MTAIRDIRRAHCPACGGESLHLMQSGLILCLAEGCPSPDAAQQILSERETEHIVQFDEHGWNMIHPLRDRLGDLLGCPVHEAVNRLPGPPAGIIGKYRVRPDGKGGLEVELLEATGSGTS